MEELGKIFDSSARVKIMRLFILNESTPFVMADITKRTQLAAPLARKEVRLLLKTGFLSSKNFTEEVTLKTKAKTGKVVVKKKKASGWVLNKKFPLVEPLRTLLIESELIRTKDLPHRFKASGNLKLLVLSGIFVKDNNRKLDMLIVGEKMDKNRLEKVMKTIESEIGKELRYSVFTPEEFTYRMNMYDRLILDIFDYPHQRIIDRIKK
ncbi:MAG: hypothetical protein ACI83D_000399 [Planctomycetota bacterium]|jgi:hypothetical protein